MDLQANHALELFGRLQQTAAAFAAREEELLRDLRTRRHALEWRFRDATEKVTASAASQIEALESFSSEETDRIRAIFEGRRARIQRAQATAIRNLPKRAKDAKQRWMGDLQMRQFRSERNLTAAQEAATRTLNEFAAQLIAQRSLLAGLNNTARKLFGGYGSLLKLLPHPGNAALEKTIEPGGEAALLEELRANLETASRQLDAFKTLPLPKLFSALPLAIVLPLIAAAGGGLTFALGSDPLSYGLFGGGTAALLAGILVLHRIGFGQAKEPAAAIAAALVQANTLHNPCAVAGQATHDRRQELATSEYERAHAAIKSQWDRAGDIESEFEAAARSRIGQHVPRAYATNARLLAPKLTRLETERAPQVETLRADAEVTRSQLTQTHAAQSDALTAEEKSRWIELETAWKTEMLPLVTAVERMGERTLSRFPDWSAELVERWTPPEDFSPAVKFGHLDLDLAKAPGSLPKDPRLALPSAPHLEIPLALAFPQQGSLLFETQGSGDSMVIGALNNIILRLLATTPPGKLSFTIIDPVGLGQNFAGLMHLSDYEESLINRRIWTQRDQIDERLTELSEHIEKVIQMYLRNEYANITDYNAQAGSVAEKYHFLVVADFPANFSETAAKKLQSIALSGPRCGIFTLIHWDRRHNAPEGFEPEELRKQGVCIRQKNGVLSIAGQSVETGAALRLDAPPSADFAIALTHKIGKSSIDSNRVQVPFEQIAPGPDELWQNDTTQELRIAVGRTGATKLQYLAIGKGTRQHALFAGKTGSGKSTLFHVIITNLALACSPEQVEFYLIDFKKGVEFKCYASQRLPHARVVAIESDREFALSVLQRVDEELKRRGDMFRKLGVQDIAGYKRAGGTEPIPRTLLIIDEFQEFFVEDDAIAQGASLLFDRIVRQGRAFGIHVLLGSQSLGGAYSLARATIGQMVIRVALQCNEADAYLIMDDSNSAPRLLSRPGEGIYNDAGGAVEGNSPFQVVWLPDDERDQWLEKVRALADARNDRHSGPIVFEGNAPADIEENYKLSAAIEKRPAARPAAARAWLGAPNSIKGPTEAVFQRQSGNHLIIVGQRDEAALSMLGLSMLSIAAQYPVGAARFVLLNGTAPESADAAFLDQIVAAIPHGVTVARGQDIGAAINGVSQELKERIAGAGTPDSGPVFVFIHGLHKFKKLRHEDDFSFSMSSDSEGESNPGAQFTEIITEGSSQGLHLIVTVDTFNNVNRFLSRKALSEFEMRVVFQMSANDSASLIDSPRAGGLGLHRALFYNEHDGTLETFRPYAAPPSRWLEKTAAHLKATAPI